MSPAVTCSPAMFLPSFSNMFPITPLVTSAHCSCVNLRSVSLSQGFCTYCFLFLECTSVPYPCGFFSHLLTVSWSSFPRQSVVSFKVTVMIALRLLYSVFTWLYFSALSVSPHGMRYFLLFNSNWSASLSSRTCRILFTAKNSACNRAPGT